MSPNIETKPLPVFFFHGLTRNGSDGEFLKDALAAQGRDLIPLSFATDMASGVGLNQQIPLAIEQIRSIVATDERFQNGYVFVGHSQGGVIARAVVEEMDDHQIHTLVSLAGVQNGSFFGPQPEDATPLNDVLSVFGPMLLPTAGFDFKSYHDDTTTWRGKAQRDLATLFAKSPNLQDEVSFTNLQRAPSRNDFLAGNAFLPKINNLNKVESAEEAADQQRRKNNFLKLKAAHFFASPGDGVVTPWQISVFGRYSEVDSLEEIETKFENLKILEMRDTTEYKEDTFGLKTLDERGGLHLHVVPNVPHAGWLVDSPLVDDPTQVSEFATVFKEYISLAFE